MMERFQTFTSAAWQKEAINLKKHYWPNSVMYKNYIQWFSTNTCPNVTWTCLSFSSRGSCKQVSNQSKIRRHDNQLCHFRYFCNINILLPRKRSLLQKMLFLTYFCCFLISGEVLSKIDDLKTMLQDLYSYQF